MDEVYRHSNRLVFTAGVKHIADTAGAYWLIDLVASYQHMPKVRAEEFQLWELKVNPDNSAVASMTDGNDGTKPIIEQKIPFTDYAKAGESECKLYCVLTPGQPATLMQPCEY